MPGERRHRILALLTDTELPESGNARLCEVSATITRMSGAGIMLMTNGIPRGSLCSSNTVSALIEELQFELGEGPCIDAHNEDRPVLEPDLVDPVLPRWLAFSGPAINAGVRAIFGFPLQVGSVRLGALNLYNNRSGPMTNDQHTDALVMADVAAQAVLVMQSNAPPGMLAAELDASAGVQVVVHQACGMVAAQLEASVAHALIRLRALAFTTDRRLADVARDVVARELRFHSDHDDPTDSPPPT